MLTPKLWGDRIVLTMTNSRFDHSKIVGVGFSKVRDEVIDASDYSPACPQHSLTTLLPPDDLGIGQAVSLLEATPLLQGVVKQSEDCLNHQCAASAR
jgi:hypothetical protein